MKKVRDIESATNINEISEKRKSKQSLILVP